MLITVTQEHIDSAYADPLIKDIPSKHCPIALALKDKFKVDYVCVELDYCIIGQFPDDIIGSHIELPQTAMDFISTFDSRNPVTPFSFELDLSGGVE